MMKILLLWWKAFRYHFVPPSFLPAILGGLLAWAIKGKFNPFFFILTVLGVTLNHLALNMTDDYYDYLQSVDRAKKREMNPFAGGSGTLTQGLIKASQMRKAFLLFYFITIIIGFYLTYILGYAIFVFGLFGIFCSYFYTAPPIRYGYHGFGELSQLINFSITIGLGSYYVQAQNFSWEVIWITLPLGFMMFSMITINEIPDIEDDRAGGKRNLVVIMGLKKAFLLYGFGMSVAYLIIAAAPICANASFFIYFSFFTVPWFVKALIILKSNLKNSALLAPANRLTIMIHNSVGIILIGAYIIEVLVKHKGDSLPIGVWLPALILTILYMPVAWKMFISSAHSRIN